MICRCPGIPVHRRSHKVGPGLKGGHCFFKRCAVCHNDAVGILFFDLSEKFRCCQAVSSCTVRAVNGNNIGKCIHALIHFAHGHGDPAGISWIFSFDQSNHRQSGLFFDANDIAHRTGANHLCACLSGCSGHIRLSPCMISNSSSLVIVFPSFFQTVFLQSERSVRKSSWVLYIQPGIFVYLQRDSYAAQRI